LFSHRRYQTPSSFLRFDGHSQTKCRLIKICGGGNVMATS
jgi:hypothetical protein